MFRKASPWLHCKSVLLVPDLHGGELHENRERVEREGLPVVYTAADAAYIIYKGHLSPPSRVQTMLCMVHTLGANEVIRCITFAFWASPARKNGPP